MREDVEKTGPGSAVAERLLRRIGFRYAGTIDPFDGGPHYTAKLGDVKIFRECQSFRYAGIAVGGKRHLVLTEKGDGVRALLTSAKFEKGGICLPSPSADLLKVKKGEKVYVWPWR